MSSYIPEIRWWATLIFAGVLGSGLSLVVSTALMLGFWGSAAVCLVINTIFLTTGAHIADQRRYQGETEEHENEDLP